MNPTHLALKALKKKALPLQGGGGSGGGGGAIIGSDENPNGSVTGQYVGQIYFFVPDGYISSIWVFNGTPGENQGWIGTL